MTTDEALAVLDSAIARSGHVVASDLVQARATFAALGARLAKAEEAAVQLPHSDDYINRAETW